MKIICFFYNLTILMGLFFPNTESVDLQNIQSCGKVSWAFWISVRTNYTTKSHEFLHSTPCLNDCQGWYFIIVWQIHNTRTRSDLLRIFILSRLDFLNCNKKFILMFFLIVATSNDHDIRDNLVISKTVKHSYCNLKYNAQ